MTTVRTSAVLERLPLFVNSWVSVNASRVAAGQPELVLKSGISRQNLTEQGEVLRARAQTVTDGDDGRIIAAAQRDGLEAQCRDAMESWRKAALYQLDGSAFITDLPILPPSLAVDKELLADFDTVLARWQTLNEATGVSGFTPPLVTREGTTRAQFAALVEEFRAKSNAVGTLDDGLSITRAERDNLAGAVHGIFAEYRKAILANYPDSSPFVENLPTLNAPDTGTTPEAVQLSATFDPATRTAHATWTASDAADIERYSMRISAGPKYKSDAEATIGDLAPEVREFTIGQQYLPVGATVWAKVYVVTDGGREKGSNAEKVSG